MIDWQITKHETGNERIYFIKQPNSAKKVYRICNGCGKGKWVQFRYANKLCRSCSLIGRKVTNKTREKMSNSHIGKPNNRKGKHLSVETKKKIGNANRDKKHSLEDRIKKSCAHLGINVEDFNGFVANQKYCKLFSESFKEIIRNRDHRICYLCGKSEGKRKLSVHHVNYDKSCLCNSTCEFVPLCQSCHAKTNSNRQYWEDLIMNYLYPERYFIVEI